MTIIEYVESITYNGMSHLIANGYMSLSGQGFLGNMLEHYKEMHFSAI